MSVNSSMKKMYTVDDSVKLTGDLNFDDSSQSSENLIPKSASLSQSY